MSRIAAAFKGARSGLARDRAARHGLACHARCSEAHTFARGCLLVGQKPEPPQHDKVRDQMAVIRDAAERLLRERPADHVGAESVPTYALDDLAKAIAPGPVYPLRGTADQTPLTPRQIKAFLSDLPDEDLDGPVALIVRCDHSPDHFHCEVPITDVSLDLSFGCGTLLLSEIGCEGVDDDHPEGHR